MQLSAEQTLALYGRNISGYFYNKNTARTYNIEFTYQRTMDYWRPNDYRDTPTYIHSMGAMENNDGINVKQSLQQSRFLIYATTGNEYTYPFPVYGGGDGTHSNLYLELPFSVSFSGLTVWDQFFMWSAHSDKDNYPSERSYISNISDVSYDRRPYYKWYSSNYYHRMSLAQFPMYPAVSVDAVSNNESRLMYAPVIHNSIIGGDTQFDMNGQTATLNWCGSYDLADEGTGLPIAENVTGDLPCLLIFISCPYVSADDPLPDFTAPGTTGTGIGTTATYQTFPTVDLSALESGVGTMVQMQDEGNYYQRIQIDQLNTIIQQLEAIYAKMVENGEVPVSLNDADSYPKLNSSVLSDVDSLTTYTIAQLPDVGSGVSGITGFIQPFTQLTWLMPIGLFSLGFSIFCWVLFRGRG